MKIRQDELNYNQVKNGIVYFDTANPNNPNNISTTHIRLKAFDGFTGGVFINNNPYLLLPEFGNDGYWDLNTHGNCWIHSIKFNMTAKNSLYNNSKTIIIEAFYDID